MKKQNLVVVICSILLLVIAGCTTIADARAAKGTGKSRTYNATYDEVWEKLPTIISDLSLKVVGDNKEEGYILAQKEITLVSYGENVAVFVYKVDEANTKVEVVSKKSMQTNILAWNWEKPILDKLSETFDVISEK